VISRTNLWYKALNTILIWSGIISSFVYAYYAAFVLDGEHHSTDGSTSVAEEESDYEGDNNFKVF